VGFADLVAVALAASGAAVHLHWGRAG